MFIDYVIKNLHGTWRWVTIKLYQSIVIVRVGKFRKTYAYMQISIYVNILEKTYKESFIIHQIGHVRFLLWRSYLYMSEILFAPYLHVGLGNVAMDFSFGFLMYYCCFVWFRRLRQIYLNWRSNLCTLSWLGLTQLYTLFPEIAIRNYFGK